MTKFTNSCEFRQKEVLMMLKRFTTLAVCFMFLSMATVVFAEDVFKTKNGKKYHAENCPLIQNKGAEKIALNEAVEKGLTPCSKCFKEEASLKSKETKKVAKKASKKTKEAVE